MLCYIVSWVLTSLNHFAVLIEGNQGRTLPPGSAHLAPSSGLQIRRPGMIKTKTRFPHELWCTLLRPEQQASAVDIGY